MSSCGLTKPQSSVLKKSSAGQQVVEMAWLSKFKQLLNIRPDRLELLMDRAGISAEQ
jgi:hypothetical protein